MNLNAKKINIDYCQQATGDTCNSCAFGTKLVNNICKVENENYIEGCETYNTDKTACTNCNNFYTLKNGKCTFKNECGNFGVIEMCLGCEDGYYLSTYPINKCIAYDGTDDSDNGNNGKRININFALVYLLLALL